MPIRNRYITKTIRFTSFKKNLDSIMPKITKIGRNNIATELLNKNSTILKNENLLLFLLTGIKSVNNRSTPPPIYSIVNIDNV